MPRRLDHKIDVYSQIIFCFFTLLKKSQSKLSIGAKKFEKLSRRKQYLCPNFGTAPQKDQQFGMDGVLSIFTVVCRILEIVSIIFPCTLLKIYQLLLLVHSLFFFFEGSLFNKLESNKNEAINIPAVRV